MISRQSEEDEFNEEMAVKDKEREEKQNAPVKCPSCGSTQIQLVSKKWSVLTGFMTNKVDRVCVNCKRKF